ncbi:MAG TPA: hypothetical protein VES01_05075 [Dermatophilaceae bacterium]|nr:hypothetical protein [Dermatophilaceae bacterium]
MTEATHNELADRVRAAALAVDGVLDLHGGALAEVATYLPGRRVSGVRLTPDRTTVQLKAAYEQPMRAVADRVRSAVRPLVGTPVDVVIADVDQPTQASAAASDTATPTPAPTRPAPASTTPVPTAPTTPPGGPS